MNTALLVTLITALTKYIYALESLQQVPSCASNCLATAVSQSSCAIDDAQCTCSDKVLLNQVAACKVANCTVKETLLSQNISSTICGVPVRDHTSITPVISTTFGSLAIIAIILRMLSRLPWSRFSFGFDDVSVLLSLACMLPPMVYTWIFREAGLGRDIWTVSFDNITRILYGFYLCEIFYFGAITFAKTSVLLFYLRVFPSGTFHKYVYAVMVMSLCYGFTYLMVTILQCLPISYSWTRWDGEHSGTCVDVNKAAWPASVFNIFIDLVIIILPIPRLVRLNLSRRKKVQVIAMFSVGLFVTIVSIVRLGSLVKWANSPNFTYDGMPAIYWSQIESEVAIICACMPGIRAFLSSFFPNIFGDSTSSSKEKFGSDTKVRNTPQYTISTRPRRNEDDFIELVEEHSTITNQPAGQQASRGV